MLPKINIASWIRVAALSAALSLNAFSQPASPEAFETGNGLYAQGKFKEALQTYESLVESGNYSANLFYNLANAEFRLGDHGKAALNYERTLALEPSHPEAHANLAFVRAQTGAKLTEPEWWNRLFVDLPTSAYAVIAALMGWAALFGCVALLFRTPNRSSSVSSLILRIASCLFIAAYCVAAIRFLQKDDSFAVITAKRSDARFAPMESAQLAETLPAGSHVRVLTRSGIWAYCSLPNGNRAWLPNDTIEPLKPRVPQSTRL